MPDPIPPEARREPNAEMRAAIRQLCDFGAEATRQTLAPAVERLSRDMSREAFRNLHRARLAAERAAAPFYAEAAHLLSLLPPEPVVFGHPVRAPGGTGGPL